MKERPIIYGPEMIKAKLDGRKTQTRRPIAKAWDGHTWAGAIHPAKISGWIAWWPGNTDPEFTKKAYDHGFPCQYGQPGDVLWTREAYQIALRNWDQEEVSGYYSADGSSFNDVPLLEDEWDKLVLRKDPYRVCPGRFMYKSLCRMRDEIVTVRPERLLQVSLVDVHAEGFLGFGHFFKYWDSLYTKKPEYQLEANPWIWAIEFRKVVIL